MKCVCVYCDAVGVPEPGYDFFVCGPCLDRAAELIERFVRLREAEGRERRAAVGGGVG